MANPAKKNFNLHIVICRITTRNRCSCQWRCGAACRKSFALIHNSRLSNCLVRCSIPKSPFHAFPIPSTNISSKSKHTTLRLQYSVSRRRYYFHTGLLFHYIHLPFLCAPRLCARHPNLCKPVALKIASCKRAHLTFFYFLNGGHNVFYKDNDSHWWSTFFGSDDTAPWREKPGVLPITFDTGGKIHPEWAK